MRLFRRHRLSKSSPKRQDAENEKKEWLVPTETPETPTSINSNIDNDSDDDSSSREDYEKEELDDEEEELLVKLAPLVKAFCFPELLLPDELETEEEEPTTTLERKKYKRFPFLRQKKESNPHEKIKSTPESPKTPVKPDRLTMKHVTFDDSPNGETVQSTPPTSPTNSPAIKITKEEYKEIQRFTKEHKMVGMVIETPSPLQSPSASSSSSSSKGSQRKLTKTEYERYLLKKMERENRVLDEARTKVAIRKLENSPQVWKPRYNKEATILYSFVARDGAILCDAFGYNQDVKVCRNLETLGTKLVQDRRADLTGWSLKTVRQKTKQPLRTVQYTTQDINVDGKVIRWTFGSVYSPFGGLERIQVQSFLEKISGITELFRQEDYHWQYGSYGDVQPVFGCILSQRMEEVSYMGKFAMMQNERVDCEEPTPSSSSGPHTKAISKPALRAVESSNLDSEEDVVLTPKANRIRVPARQLAREVLFV